MSARKPKSRNKKSWRLLPFQVLRAAENMAIDEAVFRLTRREGLPPTLRFFGWQPPAVSLGYFQRISKIGLDYCRGQKIDIVRRPTGGKAVLHEHELTYSLSAAVDDPLFTGGILGTYRVISSCIMEGLKRFGLAPEMVSDGRSAVGTPFESYCFAVPSKHELLLGGRKICGSAQVRGSGSFLQHGSLLLDMDPARIAAVMGVKTEEVSVSTTTLREQIGRIVGRDELAWVLQEAFEDTLGITLVAAGLTTAEKALRDRLLAGKYNSDLWNLDGITPSCEEIESSGA